MAHRQVQLALVGASLEDQSSDLRLLAAQPNCPPGVRGALLEQADRLYGNALAIKDFTLDIRFVEQVLRMGRRLAGDPNLQHQEQAWQDAFARFALEQATAKRGHENGADGATHLRQELPAHTG